MHSNFYAKYPGYSGDSPIPHPLPCEYALSHLKQKKNGVFIDVGAHNGIAWSNSLIFEKLFSWTGVCIEANKILYDQLAKNRDCICLNHAIDEEEKDQEFWSIVGGASGLGGLQKGFIGDHEFRVEQELRNTSSTCTKITVKTTRLDTVLAKHNISHIDYLSIDVEGNELSVLKSIDLNTYDCKLISAESNNRARVQDYLGNFGYKLLVKICADDFYAK